MHKMSCSSHVEDIFSFKGRLCASMSHSTYIMFMHKEHHTSSIIPKSNKEKTFIWGATVMKRRFITGKTKIKQKQQLKKAQAQVTLLIHFCPANEKEMKTTEWQKVVRKGYIWYQLKIQNKWWIHIKVAEMDNTI